MRRAIFAGFAVGFAVFVFGVAVAYASTPTPTSTPLPCPSGTPEGPLSEDWLAVCGHCVPTPTPGAIPLPTLPGVYIGTPTPAATPTPASTPTPTATPAPPSPYWLGEWYECAASTVGGWSGMWSCGDIVIPDGAAGIVTSLVDYTPVYYHIDGRATTGDWSKSARLQDGTMLITPYCLADSYHGYRAADVCSSYSFRGEGWLKLGERVGGTLSVGGYYDTHNNDAPPGSITYAVAFIYDSSRVSPPGPTPEATPEPTPPFDCSAYQYADGFSPQEPLVDISWEFGIVSGDCFVLIPRISVDIPAIPLISPNGFHFDNTGVNVCIYYVSLPDLSIAGVSIPMEALVSLLIVFWYLRKLT